MDPTPPRRPARSYQDCPMPEQPAGRFYFAAMSPYSWFAAERIDGLLPERPLASRVAGGLHFKAAGRTSWGLTTGARTASRTASARRRVRPGADPLARAVAHERRRRGPGDDLREPRAAEAVRAGGDAARVPWRRGLSKPRGAAADGAREGSPSAGAPRRTRRRRREAQLREETDAASARGVIGIPTVAVGDELFWGDDRLEEAAAAA